MNKLVIAIPTYNRAEMIEEMLIRCAGRYADAGIDVYFFDSSEENKTQQIVEDYKVNYKNLYYKRIPSAVHSNRKVLDIYREFAGNNQYEYLWICQDHVQLTEKGVELLLEKCEKDFDICVLNYRDVEKLGEREYSDINEVFFDCAWNLTSYMAAVVSRGFLQDVEWEHIYQRYTIPRRINHSHVALLFEQLSKKQTVKVIHVPISPKYLSISSFRVGAYWQKEIFSVWCDYWPDMIRALPDCYQRKNEVIRKHGINSGLLIWDNFVQLRKENIYDNGVYEKYRLEWENLTNVPRGLLWLLSVFPAKAAGSLGVQDWKRKRLRKHLRTFCAENKEIYVYGCGFVAKKVSDLLDALNLKYQGYMVSDLSNEKKYFHGLEIISFDEFLKKGSQAGIILAMKKEHAEQVMKEKTELSAYHIFFMYHYEDILG